MKGQFSWSLTAALAGILFGFDTVVISGADLALQKLWNTSDALHGWLVMASALWATVLGSIFGNYPTDRIGRKGSMLLVGGFFLISAIGSAFAWDPVSFACFRFLGGLGIGISTIAVPAYITEIAEGKKRGSLVALYQLSIVIGILIAMCSNYLLQGIGPEAWRWMLGVEAIPAMLYLFLLFPLPESPLWLANKRSYQLSKKRNKADSIWTAAYRKPLLWVIAIAFFNQFSGINAVLYYAPRIFKEAGLAQEGAFLSSVGIGLINLVFTLIGMGLIDRWGRRKLLVVGSICYIISLSFIALTFFGSWDSAFVVFGIFLFIASHAFGQGTVIWVFIAEVFPTELRARGQAIGSGVHWILAALIPTLIPLLFSSLGPAIIFGFFALMMVLQLLWTLFEMPETKNEKVS